MSLSGYVKVKDTPYVRDLHSKGLIATDTAMRDNYIARKTILKNINEKTNEIKDLRDELNTVKAALLALTDKN